MKNKDKDASEKLLRNAIVLEPCILQKRREIGSEFQHWIEGLSYVLTGLGQTLEESASKDEISDLEKGVELHIDECSREPRKAQETQKVHRSFVVAHRNPGITYEQTPALGQQTIEWERNPEQPDNN
ncbi:hypothetical protein J5X98_00500 [Leptothermofonsia sichuanensis E412]|uniref:hypothetical protein n=1 Tax=Leptothermofonsia sichuanensis TaxID=2917832 RepID=UPI001CA69B87|nr:hypothetical protein [Leptothermofonsia sichuanensis]QZZ21031.1 hypothetical protein J5X98_00500 [Leptothermofonsia sichuanensis E412]